MHILLCSYVHIETCNIVNSLYCAKSFHNVLKRSSFFVNESYQKYLYVLRNALLYFVCSYVYVAMYFTGHLAK